MEIMSWKERAKDVYSQVAMHQKKRTSERRERVIFLIHCNEFPKVVPALLMFLFQTFPYFFTFEFEDWKRTTVKIRRSSNQRHK